MLFRSFAAIDADLKAEETARNEAVSQLESSISGAGGAASGAINDLRTELRREIETVRNTAKAAYSASNKCFAGGYYTGNGLTGSSNARSLNFGFKPSFFVVWEQTNNYHPLIYSNGSAADIRKVTATSTGASWYTDMPESMMNKKGSLYYYIAFR